MNDAVHSSNWYRVAGLRPALRAHVQIGRHVYRGEIWFVLQDPATGRSQRFTPVAHRILMQMDGRATVGALWESAARSLGDDAPTQDEFIGILAQLHRADAIAVDIQPDTVELFARQQQHARQKRRQRFGNPLAQRFPLWNPDAFLTRTQHRVAPLLGRWGAALWLLTVTAGLFAAVLNWSELRANFSDQLLAPGSLMLFGALYPLIKALHELGHAYAVKLRGAEVREMGVILMLLMPVPYVDASASSMFADKRHRMLVGAAGIMVEVFLAAVAMLIWAAVEPGTVRAVAYSVMLIAGFSTVLFNGNPLLRYDGYYMLADALEMPNLAVRANQQAGGWLRRRILGGTDPTPVSDDRAQRRWLACYAVASFLYRWFVTVMILLFIADLSLLAAAAVAAWILAMQVVKPGAAAIRGLVDDPLFVRRRARVLAMTGGSALALIVLVAVVPVPLSTTVQGIVWAPQQAEVRAGVDGTVVRLLAAPGSRVVAGTPLVELSNPLMPTRVATATAELREVEASLDAARTGELVQASILEGERDAARARLTAEQLRAAQQVVASAADGIFMLPRPEDLPGRYLRQGDRIGFVVSQRRTTIIAAVPQEDIALVRGRTRSVAARLVERRGELHVARLDREVPAASARLPSAALSRQGGGPFATAPDDPEATRTLDRVFQVELSFDRPPERLGGRAFVRFDHGWQSLLGQWNRRLRQLFLRRFDA